MCVGVIKLFERPWWERIWVYQEYVLSKEVIFWCGPDTLNSELFRIAICTWEQFMSDQGKKRPTAELKHTYTDYILKSSNRFRRFDSHRFLRRAEEGRNARQRGYDLLDLIYRTKHLKSTDPRDKIYALLGLDESGDISVSPNYDDSISKVYTDFAIACIEAKGNLEIFYSAGIGHVVQNLPQPSWVPDWRFLSMKGDSLNLFKFDACSNRKKNCFIDPSHSFISVVGIACDAVKATILPEDKQYFRNLQTELNEMAKLALACPQNHPAGISRLQAFFRTTIADDTGPGFGRIEFKGAHEEQEFVDLITGFMVASGGFRPEQDRQDPTLSEEIERREETSEDNHPHAAHLQSLLDEELAEPTVQTYQENLDPFLASFNPLGKLKWPFRMRRCSDEEESKISVWMDRYTMTFRRSFFITETGYMGLGPPMMQAGDKICIIYGCHIPMVLREVGDSHLLVGECYVYGMMMGEMIAELEAGKRTEERFHIK
ncbi:hypothetical protein L207DRAFT_565647 [Hyaloscypha variabilis F]|uniref:Heterokaryon incompatibility domain-containing protein n=1 Tax=Hyaloscypha variabilis (strain UAMH 11265 / GT02V1 / F) TaxID=1149755 RepID=A0A2J6RTQ2_HYAVF|nr:hypothetical protein L207DRAFT_565647 [Hyaloscypha variabilis F]